MRIAFVSLCDPASLCAIEAVRARHEVVAVFRPGPAQHRRRAGLPRDPLRIVGNLVRQQYYRRYFERLDHLVTAELGVAHVDPQRDCVDVSRAALRAPDAGALLTDRNIDALVVSGGPVLKPAFYGAARWALNLHMGITPNYRGEHTLFWPLRLGDWDSVGATIHHLDEGIDTGAVVARAYPALDPQVAEAQVWARAAKMLADELVAWLDALEAGAAEPLPESHSRSGTFVRYNDRRVRHDLMWEARRRVSALGPPLRPAVIERRWVSPGSGD